MCKIFISNSMTLQEAIDACLDVIIAAEGELPDAKDWPVLRKMCCTYLHGVADNTDKLSRNADMVFLVMGFRDALIQTFRAVHTRKKQKNNIKLNKKEDGNDSEGACRQAQRMEE